MSASAWESGVGRLGAGPAVPLASLLLREHGAGLGWRGWGRVRQADRASAPALFARAQEHGLVPGAPVMLTLSRAGGGPVRSWPSVLTDLVVRSDAGAGAGAVPAVCVRIADPLTHLGARPLHAVFEGRSPGEIVVGCLARAAGAGVEDGPLRFAHPAFPTVSADERVREDAQRIGCAIACGEPMLEFLRRLLGELGIAITVRGLASGEVRVELADGEGAPEGDADDTVRLAASFAPETGEGTLRVRRLAVEEPPPPGSTEGRKSDGSSGSDTKTKGWVPRLSARSEAPGIRAGGRVELTDGPVAETREWRVFSVTHRLADRAYENVSFLERYGASPLIAPAAGEPPPRTLTAAVDEDGSDPGAPVAVDAKGRLRMRLASDPGAAVRLPCIVPSAGAVHGFAPAFCRGDRVRVRVAGPLRVEIAGALWSEALAPDEETRGAAQTMRIAPGLGAAFHPAENVPEMAK